MEMKLAHSPMRRQKSSQEPEQPKLDSQTELFYRRFRRQYDLRMKKLLKEHSLPPSNYTDGRDVLNAANFFPAPENTHYRGTLLSPLNRKGDLFDMRKAPNAYSQVVNSYRRGRQSKRKANAVEEIPVSKSSERGLKGVAQIVSELKAIFTRMPLSANTPHGDMSAREEIVTSPKSSHIEIIPLPRISLSTTPRRHAANDSLLLKSQRRRKASSRRVKDQVDMAGLQQYFNEFHQKSRDLVQRLETNVVGK